MSKRRLPSGWEEKISSSTKKRYYFNTFSRESQWEFPREPAGEACKCSHILVKHEKSRNPSSWKEAKITRSKQDAVQLIQEFITELRQCETKESRREKFADIAKIHSDCSSAKKGGDLGKFIKGQMQPSFEKASFALRTDEMSDIVHSDSGVHVILRTE